MERRRWAQSKVERRLLLLFVVCALVPVGALALVAAQQELPGPFGTFRTTLSLVILLMLGLVSLLFFGQVRRQLFPLRRLREGARRYAERELDHEVALETGDEFEELAHSMNSIASRLREQLQRLRTMIDIDRAILSATDVESIVATILARIRELHACDAVSVSLVNPYVADSVQTYVESGEGRAGTAIDTQGLTPEEVRDLCDRRDWLVIDVKDGAPHYLEPLVRAGMLRCTVLPLFVKEELAGLVALGHRDPRDCTSDSVMFARQLVDQSGVALAHARTLDENRVLAYYDGLTHLPNRRMYQDRLGQSLHHARRRGKLVAIGFLDLDGFKRINETLGYRSGDRLLRQAAERLLRVVRRGDSVARTGTMHADTPLSRLGGDEFTFLLTEISNAGAVAKVARRVLEALGRPFVVDGHEVVVTASIGLAVFPFDGEDAETLLRNADTAMSAAKRRGRNTFQFYTDAMNAASERRLDLESRLRNAVERDALTLHYQPVRDAESGRVTGAEALLRWDDPEIGPVSPAEFIPIAEESSLILDIGDWAIRSVCERSKAWERAGYHPIRMAVNLSGLQLRQPAFLENLRAALRESGVSPGLLELEITESTIMQDDDVTVQAFRELQEMGIGIALDDFGTGYSSLSYLRRFPVHRVKIDRSFVSEVPTDLDGAALTEAIIAMAHGLRLKVVAEGVETREQADFLRERGCDELQGFLFSPAVPAEEFVRFLEMAKPEEASA